MKTPKEIAQWVIDNRFSKSENEKTSDLEMWHAINDAVSQSEKRAWNEALELAAEKAKVINVGTFRNPYKCEVIKSSILNLKKTDR